MTSTIELSSGIKRTVNIVVPQAVMDQEVQKKMEEIAPRVRLPGFRPGKVPQQVLKKQYIDSIRAEVISKAIENAYLAALQEHQLNPAGMPKITVDETTIKGDLTFKAELEVFPEFEVQGLNEIEVVRVNATVTDEDLQSMLATLQKQHVTWEAVDRPAELNDRVLIDFEGFKGEEAFQGGKATDFHLVLGSKTMIPGFEDGLVAKRAGDEFDMPLTFPADYHVDTLKGQDVHFKIKVKTVEAPKLPELNDDFAKLFELASFSLLETEIRDNMKRELELALKGRIKEQVIDGLLKFNAIELPQALVDEESHRLAERAKERMRSWGQQQAVAPVVETFVEEARRRVSLGLIMNRVIMQHGLTVDPSRVEAMLNQMASVYDQPAEVVQMLRKHKERMSEIEQIVLEEQVVDKVLESARIVEEQKTFNEVMKPADVAANVLPQG